MLQGLSYWWSYISIRLMLCYSSLGIHRCIIALYASQDKRLFRLQVFGTMGRHQPTGTQSGEARQKRAKLEADAEAAAAAAVPCSIAVYLVRMS